MFRLAAMLVLLNLDVTLAVRPNVESAEMVKKMVGASSASESQESGSHDAGTLRVCFIWESCLIFFRILLASPKTPA